MKFGTRYSLNLEQMARILCDFYGGKPLRRIAHDFRDDYGIPISPPTIYRRIILSVARVDDFLSYRLKRDPDFRVRVGGVWEADGTFARMDLSLISVRDLTTAFALGNSISKSENQASAEKAFREAKEIAHRKPEKLRIDGNPALYKAARKVLGNDVCIEVKKKVGVMGANTSIEGFNSIIKSRIRRMRGVHSSEASKIIIRGLIIDYNFARPSEVIGGITPAEKAKLNIRRLFPNAWLTLLDLAFNYKRKTRMPKFQCGQAGLAWKQTSIKDFIERDFYAYRRAVQTTLADFLSLHEQAFFAGGSPRSVEWGLRKL
ncbi:DDE-type integrase/transposase/recombinase [Candidatus Bathyarchaeota archaeon]|nr:DDE-type integrase/transposase/recombinase [Candidatus Bathyarchaeota archaeon]